MLHSRRRLAVLLTFFGAFVAVGSLSYAFPDFLDHSMAASRIAAGQVLYRDHIEYINVYHYPPVYLYTLGALYAVVGTSMLAAKALVALSTVLTGGAVYVLARKLLDDRRAWLAALLFLGNPMTFVGVYGGYFDPFVTVFMLSSIVLLVDERSVSAGILLAIGVMSKPFAVLLAPIVACYCWQRRRAALWTFGAAFAATVGVISLPFLLLAPEAYVRYAVLYNFQRTAASMSAYYYFAPWLLGTIWTTVLPAAWVVSVTIAFARLRANGVLLFADGVSLLLLGFLVFNRINYPHYLLYLTPFLSIAFVRHYARGTSLANRPVWTHLAVAFGGMLLGAGLWAYPWVASNATAGFRSDPLFRIGAGIYFLASLYLGGVLILVVARRAGDADR